MCLGIPGQVVEVIDNTNHIAKVDVSGVKRNVSVALVRADGDDVQSGDWVLIHVGFAMSKIDEQEAQSTLDLLNEMGQAYADELEMLHKSMIE